MTLAITLRLRAALKSHIRAFFERRGFLEIDTPIAVACPGTEVHLRYFETSWQDLKGKEHPLYLRSSPELHMKQAVAYGVKKSFQIAPCFRNGGELAQWHHPEFTMLEWYETDVTFDDFITETEDLLRETCDAMLPALATEGCQPNFKLPGRLRRITVAEAFKEFAAINLVDLDPDLAKKARQQHVLSVTPQDDFETAFFKILIERVEPGLAALGGTVLYDYPASQAALAMVRGPVAKRFEIYLQRVELCNGFEELLEQEANKRRIESAMAARKALNLPVPGLDQDYLSALGVGLPPCCGNALGFDRWLALLMGDADIGRAIPFRQERLWKANSTF